MKFLFLLYTLVISIAIYQDFRRREIDDWLNLFLFSSGFLFLISTQNLLTNFFSSMILFLVITLSLFFLFNRNDTEKKPEKENNILIEFIKIFSIISLSALALFFISKFYINDKSILFSIFFLINLLVGISFYYARIFSGGDAKLLSVFSPFLFSTTLQSSIYNLIIYSIILLLAGSVYGMIYSIIIFVKNIKESKKTFLEEIKSKKNKIITIIGLVTLLLAILINEIIFLSLLIFLYVILISFAKSIDETCMIKTIHSSLLREGDILVDDIKLGNKIFKKKWNGLDEQDVEYLKKINKKIQIRDGIPYAPAFLFAIIIFNLYEYFFRIFF